MSDITGLILQEKSQQGARTPAVKDEGAGIRLDTGVYPNRFNSGGWAVPTRQLLQNLSLVHANR